MRGLCFVCGRPGDLDHFGACALPRCRALAAEHAAVRHYLGTCDAFDALDMPTPPKANADDMEGEVWAAHFQELGQFAQRMYQQRRRLTGARAALRLAHERIPDRRPRQ